MGKTEPPTLGIIDQDHDDGGAAPGKQGRAPVALRRSGSARFCRHLGRGLRLLPLTTMLALLALV
jgi:hypothetical protein